MSVLFIYFAIDLPFTLEINNQRLAAVLPLTVLSIDPIREIRSDLVSRDRRTICQEVPGTLFQWTSRVYEPLKPRFARSHGGYAVRYIFREEGYTPLYVETRLRGFAGLHSVRLIYCLSSLPRALCPRWRAPRWMVPAHPPCTFISLGSSLSRIRNQPPERSCYAEIKSQPPSDGEREGEREGAKEK